MAFPAYFFDLDGTLIDSIELILASFRHTRATHFADPKPDAYYMGSIGMPLRDTFARWDDAPVSVPQLIDTYRTSTWHITTP